MSPLLLDTCALLWWLDDQLPERIADQVLACGVAGHLYVSSVSFWEIGLLVGKGRLQLKPGPDAWITDVLASPILRERPLSAACALAASFLPGELHQDPADRLLAATARDLDAALVTRDARLLAYAAAGHLQVLAC